MDNAVNVSWFRLSFVVLVLIIPIAIFVRFKTGLIRKTVIGAGRMIVQLLFVGYYLEYLFAYNNYWLNLGWILAMILVADYETLERSQLKKSIGLLFSVFVATLIGLLVIDSFLLKMIIRLPNIMAAQYLIPITGMILGNCLRGNIIATTEFYYSIFEHKERYQFFLASGATRGEALYSFFSNAIKKAMSPTLASMATTGIVSLPGIMTGQMLGGSAPLIAIKYQIMIMFSIFSGTTLCIYLSISLSQRFMFDKDNNLIESLLNKITKKV